MHASVTSYRIQPGRMDDRVRHSREVVQPLNQAQPGYRGVLVLVDRRTNQTLVVSLWEDEAHHKQADANPDRWEQLGRNQFADGEVVVDDFEAVFLDIPSPP